MEQKITTEDRERIAALYYGCDAMSIEPETGKKCYHKVYHGTLKYADQMQLLLKPLEQISDEDAIEVAKMVSNSMTTNYDGRIMAKIRSNAGIIISVLGLEVVIHFESCQIGIQDAKGLEKYFWNDNQVMAIDFLRSRGYALPYKGKCLFELGIAIPQP